MQLSIRFTTFLQHLCYYRLQKFCHQSFILKLENEERQEICNALNRRTEFRVLRTTYGLFDPIATKPEDSADKPEEEENP